CSAGVHRGKRKIVNFLAALSEPFSPRLRSLFIDRIVAPGTWNNRARTGRTKISCLGHDISIRLSLAKPHARGTTTPGFQSFDAPPRGAGSGISRAPRDRAAERFRHGGAVGPECRRSRSKK